MAIKLAIVGTGPAGYAAALYASRARMDPVVFAGPEPGGQLMYTTEVENYPGFSQGILGPQLMDEMRKQAVKFGAQLKFESVVKIDGSVRPFRITTDAGDSQAEAIILSMGAKSRMLGVGEEKYLGKGVSTCAVCDAAFFKDKVCFVVGGGDSAIEDAFALTKHARQVTMVVRRDTLRASKIMQERVTQSRDKLSVMWKSEVVAVKGEGKLEGLVIKKDGVDKEYPADGLFVAIGHEPSSGFLAGSGVEVDERGYVVTGMGLSEKGVMLASKRVKDGKVEFPTMTSVPGIFAAGDVVDFRYRQAATAGGSGVAAALDVEWWLERQG